LVAYWWFKENSIYNINRYVLQEVGKVVEVIPSMPGELLGVPLTL